MCGRKCHGRRREPALITLSMMAQQIYQERKAKRLQATSDQPPQSMRQIEQPQMPVREIPKDLSETDSVRKANIPPPSYEAVIKGNPDELRREASRSSSESSSRSSSGSFEFVKKPVAAQMSAKPDRRAMEAERKAEKAIRKAERAVRRAEERGGFLN